MTEQHRITELTEDRLGLAYPAMRELRPHLDSEQAFLAQVRRQYAQGYRIAVSVRADGSVAGALGFRQGTSLLWGEYLYIDDLITVPDARGAGHATALLHWADERARELGCGQVHLDSGAQRHAAHRRYLNHGYVIAAHHFAKDLS